MTASVCVSDCVSVCVFVCACIRVLDIMQVGILDLTPYFVPFTCSHQRGVVPGLPAGDAAHGGPGGITITTTTIIMVIYTRWLAILHRI